MPRQAKLNWDAPRNKWRVVYFGKKYRFDGGSGKSDREARKQAEAAWRATKAQLDLEAEEAKPHRTEYKNVIAEWESVLRWCIDHGEEMTATVARDKIKDLEERLAMQTPPPLGWSDRPFNGPAPLTAINERMKPVYQEAGLEPIIQVSGPAPYEHTQWQDRLETQNRRLGEASTEDTFAANVEKYLLQKRAKVAARQLSAAWAETSRSHLEFIMEFAGSGTSVSRIDHNTVQGLYNHLLGRVAAKQMSDHYAHNVFAVFKQFVRWLVKNTSHLEMLPKNIDDQDLRISVTPREVKVLTPEQIKTLMEKASPRTKLYLLLGLNSAMTQIDMAELHPNEVDWKQGIITRKRSKTGNCENVPVVSYPLWPETFELLKQERSDDPDHVLLTREGKLLRTEDIDGGKYKKTDAVRLAIRRLSKKTEIEFTLKACKKTSASLLRGNRDYQGLQSLFLDHAPQTVAEIHYTTVPQDLLNEAIAWLGQELGIVNDESD
ncbi:tyrosine-type recombinase/integrase [Gimesia sp.]|uniref:tyrosine-type recombinase/integrase n=1 Tax=Gimesia sp. TaxID=2024833 RepID=UPI003A911E1C